MKIDNLLKANLLLGTGEGVDYESRLDKLLVKSGEEIHLFRVMCEAEYFSIIKNNNKFIFYEWAMEKKWFATCYNHAMKWGEYFYPDKIFKIVEITVLKESLKFMFYIKLLDNIGPAYSADIILLNNIVRKVRLII